MTFACQVDKPTSSLRERPLASVTTSGPPTSWGRWFYAFSYYPDTGQFIYLNTIFWPGDYIKRIAGDSFVFHITFGGTADGRFSAHSVQYTNLCNGICPAPSIMGDSSGAQSYTDADLGFNIRTPLGVTRHLSQVGDFLKVLVKAPGDTEFYLRAGGVLYGWYSSLAFDTSASQGGPGPNYDVEPAGVVASRCAKDGEWFFFCP